MISGKYIELLKSPKWQKKRLEIMEIDCFRCLLCADDSNQLHVHHIYYEYEKVPWDYDADLLVTLCDVCHDKIHDNILGKFIMSFFRDLRAQRETEKMTTINREKIKLIEKEQEKECQIFFYSSGQKRVEAMAKMEILHDEKIKLQQ